MDSETERHHADAEAIRQQHELTRQAAELGRIAAEESRMSAEDGRRAVAGEVSETIATLQTLVRRMEAVESLRRAAKKDAL
jgi:methionine synthase I (cobalamin-dependent)